MIYDILPVNNYMGNGAATVFDFDFYIDDASQLKVYLYDSDGAKYLLEKDIDYILEGEKNPKGGYITFPVEDSIYGVLSDSQKISLELDIPVSQETQYNNSSLLNLASLEYSFDYLTRLIQILKRKLSLCVKVEECSKNTPEELLTSINDANVSTSLDAKEASLQKSLAQSAAKDAIRAKELSEEIYRNTKSFNEELISNGMYKFNLFDTKTTDFLLEGNEAKGWALEGTYVSKALYPDFYNKCLEQKTNAIETETTLGDSTLTMFVNSNGHQYYDISDKLIVDAYYSAYGIDDFYGIDEENECVFLPRSTRSNVIEIEESYVNGTEGYRIYKDGYCVQWGLSANIGGNSTGTVTFKKAFLNTSYSLTFCPISANQLISGRYSATKTASSVTFGNGYSYATKFNWFACGYLNKKEYITPKRYKYYCVGNTIVNDANIDAGGLVAQMELKANKADVDGQWVMSNKTLATSVSVTSNIKSLTYDLSDYLPNDGCNYEVMFETNAITGDTVAQFMFVRLLTDYMETMGEDLGVYVCNNRTRAAAYVNMAGSITLPVGIGRSVKNSFMQSSANFVGSFSLWAVGYRRIGTNS